MGEKSQKIMTVNQSANQARSANLLNEEGVRDINRRGESWYLLPKKKIKKNCLIKIDSCVLYT